MFSVPSFGNLKWYHPRHLEIEVSEIILTHFVRSVLHTVDRNAGGDGRRERRSMIGHKVKSEDVNYSTNQSVHTYRAAKLGKLVYVFSFCHCF